MIEKVSETLIFMTTNFEVEDLKRLKVISAANTRQCDQNSRALLV